MPKWNTHIYSALAPGRIWLASYWHFMPIKSRNGVASSSPIFAILSNKRIHQRSMLNTQLLAFRKSTINQPSVKQYNCSNRSLCLCSLNVFNEGTIKVTIATAYPFNSNIEKRQQMIASEGTITLAKNSEIRNRNANEFEMKWIRVGAARKLHRSVNSFNQKPIFQHVNSRSKHTFSLSNFCHVRIKSL